MNAPQIILIVLWALNLLAAANQHGKTKVRTINFWQNFWAVCLLFGLLLWGGFFSQGACQ